MNKTMNPTSYDFQSPQAYGSCDEENLACLTNLVDLIALGDNCIFGSGCY